MATTIIVAGVAGGLVGGGISVVLTVFGDRLSADLRTLLYMVVLAAMIVLVTTWGRHRTRARIPSAHRVKPVSDKIATAAAHSAVVIAIATLWTAGLARIPISVGSDWHGAGVLITCLPGLASVSAANFRLQSMARRQAAPAVKEAAEAPA